MREGLVDSGPKRAPGETRLLVLRFVRRFEREHGYPPTVRQIGEGVGLSSTDSVWFHVSNLLRDRFLYQPRKGFITSRKPRSPAA